MSKENLKERYLKAIKEQEHLIQNKLPEKTKTVSCKWCIHKDVCFAVDMDKTPSSE